MDKLGILELQAMFKALPEKIKKGKFESFAFWTLGGIIKKIRYSYGKH